MTRRMGTSGASQVALAVIALYALTLSAAPILHHDFFCHHHSPSHCVSCLSSQCAPEVEPGAESLATSLLPAGTLESRSMPIIETLTSAPSPGRSPPA